MNKKALALLVCLLMVASVNAQRSHRYRMVLDINGNCTNEAVLIAVTNEVHEGPVKGADVDVFFNSKKVFNLETNDTGVAFFTPAKAGGYFIQIDRSGYLRAETTVDVTVCEPTTTISTSLPATTMPSSPATTMPTTSTLPERTVQVDSLVPETTVPEKPETTSLPPVSTVPAAGAEGGSGVLFIVVLLILAAVAIAVAALKRKSK